MDKRHLRVIGKRRKISCKHNIYITKERKRREMFDSVIEEENIGRVGSGTG